MKPRAIDHAQERFDAAAQRLKILGRDPITYKQFRPLWAELLVALNAGTEKLFSGARGCTKSETWRNKHRNLQRTDPLIRYLHQARNADEHGIEEITEVIRPTWDLHGVRSGHTIMTDGRGVPIIVSSPNVPPPRVDYRPTRINLIDVVNSEYGDRFPVPREHLGRPIPLPEGRSAPGPLEVGGLGLEYLGAMLAEARALPAH
jgi:hypothetical protein